MSFKEDSIHNQKQIDNSKMMVEQKRMLVERLEQENAVSIKKTEACRQAIKNAKIELEKISKLTKESTEMQAKESQREEYYTIKSQVQADFAKVERERLNLEKQLGLWTQKKQVAVREKEDMEQRIEALTDLKQLKSNLKECER